AGAAAAQNRDHSGPGAAKRAAGATEESGRDAVDSAAGAWPGFACRSRYSCRWHHGARREWCARSRGSHQLVGRAGVRKQIGTTKEEGSLMEVLLSRAVNRHSPEPKCRGFTRPTLASGLRLMLWLGACVPVLRLMPAGCT